MGIFYGWVIVGVGIVVTCIGMGAMLSLSVFLQPMEQAMGWSRTGISTAALLNWLAMGVGAFVWGVLSDRYGTRAVLLLGGGLLGIGMVTASQATTLLQFQIAFGFLVGLASGSFYTPLTATTTRWFVRQRSKICRVADSCSRRRNRSVARSDIEIRRRRASECFAEAKITISSCANGRETNSAGSGSRPITPRSTSFTPRRSRILPLFPIVSSARAFGWRRSNAARSSGRR